MGIVAERIVQYRMHMALPGQNRTSGPREKAARFFCTCVLLCLAAALAAGLTLPGCSRQDSALLETPQVRFWKNFFFTEGAPIQDDGTMEFTCIPIPPPGHQPPGSGLVCNESDSVCLVIDTGYLQEQGRVVRGEPDSSVSLYYPEEKRMCRFMSIGTTGGVHGGVWVSQRVFVVFGLSEQSGFLYRADLDEGVVRKYVVPASFRKPDAVEERYFSAVWGRTAEERGDRGPGKSLQGRGPF